MAEFDKPAAASPAAGMTAFAAALLARREYCNQRFRMSRALRPGLDAESFGRSLRQWIGPWVEALPAGQADEAAAEGFEMALALLQAGHAASAPGSAATALDPLWQIIARHAPTVPAALAARLCNACLYLQAQPGVRIGEWLDGVDTLLATAADGPATALPAALQVLAWRCGVAAFRTAALQLATTLPAALLQQALRLSPDQNAATQLARLQADQWAHPADDESPPSLREVGRCGGFRGLGGHFIEVPEAVLLEGRIALQDRSGPLLWLLADAFGVQLVSAAAAPPLAATADCFKLDGTELQHAASGSRLTLPGAVAGWVSDGHCVAVMLQHSYQVRLYAVAGRGAGGQA